MLTRRNFLHTTALGSLLAADGAAGTCAIVNDEGLAGLFRELLRKQPRHCVETGSRDGRHDDAHWACGEGVCVWCDGRQQWHIGKNNISYCFC